MQVDGSTQQNTQSTVPVPGHGSEAEPQSVGQVVAFSPAAASQTRSPHAPPPPPPPPPPPLQSPGQFAAVSTGLVHVPSPHDTQSAGQVAAASPGSHMLLPHTGIAGGAPQSAAHVAISLAAQT